MQKYKNASDTSNGDLEKIHNLTQNHADSENWKKIGKKMKTAVGSLNQVKRTLMKVSSKG